MNRNLSIEILNSGLDFSMEFGENWLRSIHQRLKAEYPELNADDLDACNNICNEINRFAHEFIRENPVEKSPELKFVEYSVFENYMKKNFDWISAANLSRLYSQSCYYAYK